MRKNAPEPATAPSRGAIDLRLKTLSELTNAQPGTLVYVGAAGAAALRAKLDICSIARGLALRDVGAYHLEIVVPASFASPKAEACRFCRGAVWCGRCRRCGTAA